MKSKTHEIVFMAFMYAIGVSIVMGIVGEMLINITDYSVFNSRFIVASIIAFFSSFITLLIMPLIIKDYKDEEKEQMETIKKMYKNLSGEIEREDKKLDYFGNEIKHKEIKRT